MSVQALTWVIEHSEARLGDRLVLMSIANHADRSGDNAWPSVATMAREAHMSERQVRRALPRLVSIHELEVVEGAGPGGTHVYRLVAMAQPTLFETDTLDNSSPDNLSGGDKSGKEGVTNRAKKVADLSPKPSFNRPLTNTGDPPAGDRRDELFEAIATACRWSLDQLTDDARGRLNKATKQLRAVDATPEIVLDFNRWYRKTFPNAELTPQAITAHWPAFLGSRKPKRPPSRQETDDERRQRERQERVTNAESLYRLLREPIDLKRASYEPLEAWCERVEQAWDEHTRATA